ncbi:MAG: hypothetical protein HRU03_04710 [Nanoarchaeales archaeon]|nr:hypothetical protein [Nanoarchaeales archaeon]
MSEKLINTLNFLATRSTYMYNVVYVGLKVNIGEDTPTTLYVLSGHRIGNIGSFEETMNTNFKLIHSSGVLVPESIFNKYDLENKLNTGSDFLDSPTIALSEIEFSKKFVKNLDRYNISVSGFENDSIYSH